MHHTTINSTAMQRKAQQQIVDPPFFFPSLHTLLHYLYFQTGAVVTLSAESLTPNWRAVFEINPAKTESYMLTAPAVYNICHQVQNLTSSYSNYTSGEISGIVKGRAIW